MTVTYTAEVATSSRGLGCFWKLLFRWRGSIYKLIWHELCVYCICYAICSLIYRLALTQYQKRVFEGVALHIQEYINLIPVAFVLGFYVSIIMKRWWDMYITIPWPDNIAVFVSTSIHGQNEAARVMRRTIMRYVNLSFCITLSMISPRVKKRFPTMDHMVEMGILTEQEKNIFDIMDAKAVYSKYWMPLVWAGAIVSKARKEGRITDDHAVKTILDELNNFRKNCGRLTSYDKISVPLVYTQVVTLSVYTFFLGTIICRQFLDPVQGFDGYTVDLYVPWFTILQFFFYMGWLKVAESLINPFGEDDDDFEVNSLVDRNLVVSYLIVDEMHQDHPELIKDMYYEEVVPSSLPYTVAAEAFRSVPNHGSTAHLIVPESGHQMLHTVKEEPEPGQVQTVSNIRTASSPVMKMHDDVKQVEIPMDPQSSISRRGSVCSRCSSTSELTTAAGQKKTSVFTKIAKKLSSASSKPEAVARPNSRNSIFTVSSLRGSSRRNNTNNFINAAYDGPEDITASESSAGTGSTADEEEPSKAEKQAVELIVRF